MNGKKPNSLKELRSLREAVLAEEKAKAKALIETLPPNELAEPATETPPGAMDSTEADAPVEIAPEGLADAETVSLPEEVQAPTVSQEALEMPKPIETTADRPSPAVSGPRPPSQGPPPRPKVGTKDPALIIPLTPKIKERLQRHVEQSRWSPADLVIELVRSTLHRGYPAIHYADQILARQGTYRTIERNPFESALKIVSGQGVFNITVNPGSSEYQRWVSYFQTHSPSNVENSAAQLCLFELQRYLETVDDFTVEGWIKNIDAESFIIERLTS